MKKFYFPLAVAIIVLSAACGGGGGGSSSTNSTSTSGSTGTLNPIRAESVLANNAGQIVDPKNIQVGEAIQFQVVGYNTTTFARTVLSSSLWSTNDSASAAGTLSSSGLFNATASTGGVSYTATGHANATTYPLVYAVKPVQALVTGVIRDSNNFASSRVTIVFYTISGAEVGRASSAFNGNFRASVPTSAKRFNIDPASLDPSFYFQSFSFLSKRYTTLETATCSAPLPALTNGTTTNIGGITIDAAKTNGVSNPPPPPPDGCS